MNTDESRLHKWWKFWASAIDLNVIGNDDLGYRKVCVRWVPQEANCEDVAT